VAPDNGVLSYVINDYLAKPLGGEPLPQQPGAVRLFKAELTREAEAVAITNSRFFHNSVSATFHGRDIMAPVAGLLSLGLNPIQFGESVSSLCAFALPEPDRVSGGALVGHVMHIDSFGNLITDIQRDDLPDGGGLTVEVAGRKIEGLVNTYAESRGLLALVDSSGHLEVAMRDGSACSILDARLGDEVIVKPLKSR
jgi:S-adenosylmethionine hydrolase